MKELVEKLIQEQILQTPHIIEAFLKIDRKNFVPKELQDQAYDDYPLFIGHGQTISQPYTVAFMLELLQPASGNKVLDAGSGSGWTTALLSHIVSGPPAGGGKVFALEVIPGLKEFGEKNVSKYNFIKKGVATFYRESAEEGFSAEAPFDRMLAGASMKKLPAAWKEQLAIGGRIVAPIKDSVFLFVKKSDNEFETQEFPGFAFVPFV